MRRTALSLLAVAALAVPASAQLGVKAGVSFATLSNRSPDFDARTGFAAGISLDLGGGVIGLAPELLYVQKGTTSDGAPSSTAVKLSYAEIPVLLKVSLPIPSLQPFAYAGPSVSFRLGCEAGDTECDDDTIKSTDYGAVLGAGVKLGGRFTLEGRFNWGIADINNLSDGVDTKTRTFMVLAGFSL